MKIYLFIVFLLNVGIITAQENVEQIAFDYFFENIINNEFPTQKIKIVFSGYSEPSTSGAFSFVECLDESDSIKLIDNGFKESDLIKIKEKKFIKKINKSCSKGRFEKFVLRVYRGINMDDNKIVLLKLNKKNKRTYFYYIKIDENLNISSWCKTISIN